MQSKSHIDVVTVTAQSSSAVARSHIAASWRRSLVNYGLDPGDRAAIARLDAASLRRRQDQIGAFRAVAETELDRLFQLIGNSGSGLLLTDRDGVILDHRCKMADDDALSDIGLLPGAILNEKSEGTNGMGTCIAEERPVIVHREDHFMARSTAFTCIAVPVFGARGELIAVLDVSSACEDNSRSSSILLADVLMRSSRRIEATYFRDRYPGARIVMAETTRMDGSALLAVDADDLVVGATRAARQVFELGLDGDFDPRPASDLLGQELNARNIDDVQKSAILRAIARSSGNMSAAARQLGIGRSTLYRRMKQLGIEN